jgi:hypothetical protein
MKRPALAFQVSLEDPFQVCRNFCIEILDAKILRITGFIQTEVTGLVMETLHEVVDVFRVTFISTVDQSSFESPKLIKVVSIADLNS